VHITGLNRFFVVSECSVV